MCLIIYSKAKQKQFAEHLYYIDTPFLHLLLKKNNGVNESALLINEYEHKL